MNSILREAETIQATKSDTSVRPQRVTVWTEHVIFIHDSVQVLTLPGDADFSSYEGMVMIGVKKSDHYQFPLYRAAMGTIISGGRFVSNITPKAGMDQLRLGKVEWDTTILDMIELLERFRTWVNEQCLESVDGYLRAKGLREAEPVVKTRKNSKKGA